MDKKNMLIVGCIALFAIGSISAVYVIPKKGDITKAVKTEKVESKNVDKVSALSSPVETNGSKLLNKPEKTVLDTVSKEVIANDKDFERNVFEVFKKDGQNLLKSINRVVYMEEIKLKAIFVTLINNEDEMFFSDRNGKWILPGTMFLTKEFQAKLPTEVQPYVLELQEKKNSLEKKNQEDTVKKVKELYDTKMDKKSIIKLGSATDKPTLVMIVDTECPHCANTINALNETLKQYNVELIIPSIYAETSIQKAAIVYEEVQKLTKDEDKVVLLQKVFNRENSKEVLKQMPNKEWLDLVNGNIDLFIKSYVLKGVPFIYQK